MNIAKDFCDCIISWEIQENRKISTIVNCCYSPGKSEKSIGGESTGTLYSRSVEDHEMEFNPILVTPFLHPELTKVPYCDLKIFVSPKLGIKFDKIVLISTGKICEFSDRSGELLLSAKGEKITRKLDRTKEDMGEKPVNTGYTKYPNQKSSSRWFRKEFIPSVDLFEVLVRFVDQLVPNQLLIKYIGVNVVPFDWSSELGLYNLATPTIGCGTSTIGSTGSICSNNITVSSERILEAIQNLTNTVQILTNEIGCGHKGSNPHLATTSGLDAATMMKLRRPNSPMTPGGASPSTTYWTGTRRSSDISNLQMWLETRLATIELQFIKGIEQLSSRLSKLENQYSEQNGTIPGSYKFEKPQFPDSEPIKSESTNPTTDPMINNQ